MSDLPGSPERIDPTEGSGGSHAGTDGEPTLRLATLDDAPAMLRVLETAFDPWPTFELDVPALDHLRWKMSEPGLPAAHAVAVVHGRVEAVTIRWVSRMRLGDEVLIQDSSVDHAVHPSMQGRGLGGAIGQFGHDNAVTYSDMSLGTGTSHDAILTIFDRFDPPQVTHRLSMWSRPFGPRAFLGAFGRGGGPGLLARNAARAARSRLRRGVRPRGRRTAVVPANVRIEESQAFDDRVEPLWAAFAAQFDFMTERSVEYLNWRYGDRRAGTSLVLTAIEDDRLLGYAVFKQSGDWSNVLDLVVDPQDGRAAPIVLALLGEGCERMAAAGARGANIGLSVGHPAAPVVEAAGFLPLRWTTQYTCGPQRRGRSFPMLDRMYAGEARSHLVLGDGDIY